MKEGKRVRMRWASRAALCAAALVVAGPGRALPAAAQDDLPPGVALATHYAIRDRPILTVRPFAVPIPVGSIGQEISAIIENDLRLSDRFRVLPVPSSLAAVDTVAYREWNSINVVYLVTGEVQPWSNGWAVTVQLHDVPYGRVEHMGTFAVPDASAPDFRMAVHALSDQIVQWISNQPGMAASRIAFARRVENGYDLMIVDSDGENLRRLTGTDGLIYSPAWSPDGTRILYTQHDDEDGWSLVEREIETGRMRTLLRGMVATPTYSPDGRTIAFAMWQEGADYELYAMDAAGGARPRRLTNTPGDNMNPTFSPDGRSIAFLSTRTGVRHIYVMPAEGGTAQLLTPVGEQVRYMAPDWSPVDQKVTFSGQSRGGMQIMVGDATRRAGQIQQFTTAGFNEDPSIAPDGRHIVYTSESNAGVGLFVLDIETQETRRLVGGAGMNMPDWSPPLARPVPIRVDRP